MQRTYDAAPQLPLHSASVSAGRFEACSCQAYQYVQRGGLKSIVWREHDKSFLFGPFQGYKIHGHLILDHHRSSHASLLASLRLLAQRRDFVMQQQAIRTLVPNLNTDW
jgi:hypothetical protein